MASGLSLHQINCYNYKDVKYDYKDFILSPPKDITNRNSTNADINGNKYKVLYRMFYIPNITQYGYLCESKGRALEYSAFVGLDFSSINNGTEINYEIVKPYRIKIAESQVYEANYMEKSNLSLNSIAVPLGRCSTTNDKINYDEYGNPILSETIKFVCVYTTGTTSLS